MTTDHRDSPIPPWLRQREKENPAEFLCIPEILERAKEIGVFEPEKVLKILVDKMTARSNAYFEIPSPRREKTINGLIQILGDYLGKISRGDVNYFEGSKNISLLITITLPLLSEKSEFREFFSTFFYVLNRSRGEDKIGRMLGREFGLHFEEFKPLIKPQEVEDLRRQLLEDFPLGIVPMMSAEEIDDKTRQEFRIGKAGEIKNVKLVSSPYGLSLGGNFIEVLTPGVCPWTEVYYSQGLAKGNAPILSFNGEIFGIQDQATQTVLVVRSMKQAGQVVLLRGGIYDLTLAKNDQNDYSPNASNRIDFGQAPVLRFVPLRLWQDNQHEPSGDKPLEHDSLEEIIEKVLKKD